MKKGSGKKVVSATAPVNHDGGTSEVVATSIRIDKPLHDRLRKLAFDKRLPMANYIVRGIELVLKAEKY